jgi:tetratricopeptide (TPR) repeat protein
MKTLFTVFLVVCLFCGGLFATNEEAAELMRKGEFAEAKEVLKSASDNRGRFLFGLCCVELEQYDEAIGVLESMPGDLPEARLALARALMMEGKRRLAIKEFRSVLDMDPPEIIQRRVERTLVGLKRDSHLDFDIDVGWMYDDNATAGMSGDSFEYYGFLFAPGGSMKKQSDSAVVSFVAVDYVVPILDNSWWVSSVAFDSTNYLEWSQFDFQIARVSTGPVFQDKNWTFKIPVVVDYATLGSDRYSVGAGINPGLSLALTKKADVGISVLLEDKRYFSRSERNGLLFNVNTYVRRDLGKGLFGTLGYQRWIEDAEADHFASGTDVVYCGISKKWDKTLIGVSPSVAWSRYKGQQAGFSDKRRDCRKRVSVNLRREFWKNTSVSLRYTHTFNDSNLELYGFRRNQVSGSLIVKF